MPLPKSREKRRAEQKLLNLQSPQAPDVWIQTSPRLPEYNDDSSIINLRTPLRLKPPVDIRIVSAEPFVVFFNNNCFSLGGDQVYNIKSIKWTFITPSAKLDPSFRDGWNKLPNELKILIIKLICTRKDTTLPQYKEYEALQGQVLYPLLRMTPEIAALARPIFYRSFCYVLATRANPVFPDRHPALQRRVARTYFARPNRTVAQWITAIHLHVHLQKGHWKILENLAGGEYGFTNLRYLKVLVDTSEPTCIAKPGKRFKTQARKQWEKFLKDTVAEGVTFFCIGILSVIGPSPQRLRDLSSWSLTVDEMTTQLRQKVRFAPQAEKPAPKTGTTVGLPGKLWRKVVGLCKK